MEASLSLCSWTSSRGSRREGRIRTTDSSTLLPSHLVPLEGMESWGLRRPLCTIPERNQIGYLLTLESVMRLVQPGPGPFYSLLLGIDGKGQDGQFYQNCMVQVVEVSDSFKQGGGAPVTRKREEIPREHKRTNSHYHCDSLTNKKAQSQGSQ